MIIGCGATAYATEPVPPAVSAVRNCTVDAKPRHWTASETKTPAAICAEFMTFLSAPTVVTKNQWWHNFHHVAGLDRTSRLTLRNGRTIGWLMRPGGLAQLEFANKHRIYLVKCRLKQPCN